MPCRLLLGLAGLLLLAGCGRPALGPVVPRRDNASRLIVVYQTHAYEGYAGGGTVVDAGSALASGLTAAGFQRVVHLRRSFGPYRLAYLRSRLALLGYWWRQPLLAIDVHRDAAPPGTYAGSVAGQPTARVLFVVGRANWALWRNLALARRLAAVGGQLAPGLVKGIYLGAGEYNQGLGPGVLLVEIGNVDTPLPEAEHAARWLAGVLAAAYGVS